MLSQLGMVARVGTDSDAQLLVLKQQLKVTHLGQGVTLEIKSSTPKESPRMRSDEPSPFHNVVMPWCLWRWQITGANVIGIRWYRFELLCT